MRFKQNNNLLAYLNAGLWALLLNMVFDTLRDHKIINFVFIALYGALLIFARSKWKAALQFDADLPFTSAYKDAVKKRLNNLTYLLVYSLAILGINLYMAVISTAGRPREIFTAVNLPVRWVLFVFFLWYAAVLRLRRCCAQTEYVQCITFIRRQFLLAFALWAVYLLIGMAAGARFLMGFFLPVSLLYLAGVWICNFTVRKQIVQRNFIWKKHYTVVIVSVTVLALAVTYMRRDTWYLQGYINQIPRLYQNTVPIVYREEDGVYELHMEDGRDEFRILQLTDIHLGGSISSIGKDKKALEAVRTLITHAQPDLVIVTGDMTFPLGIMSMSLNNASPVSQFAAMMRNLNVPWAFAFGNHDTELIAALDQDALCALYRALSFKTSGTLLYPYVQPDITGRNNQLIELYNPDGTLNQALFLLDSNAYTGEGINAYDYIHEDQTAWYEAQVDRLCMDAGKPVSSMAFFHIPLQEYREAYEAYLAGGDAVTYYFGSNMEEGEGGAQICCSDYPSDIFDRMAALGSTKALFCGHDHYNNISLGYRGIRLTYGMSIDYLAMPGIEKAEAQRGGTLIRVYPDSTFDIEQIPLVSVQK